MSSRPSVWDLVESNRGFVAQVAMEFREADVPFDDLMSEGRIGLLRAARRFDGRKGTKFTTYAVWWIRKAIRELVENSTLIRIPKYQRVQVQRIRQVQQELSQRRRRPATVREVASWLRSPERRVRKILDSPIREVSLDAPLGRDQQARLLDFLPDLKAGSPEEAVLRSESVAALRTAVAGLKDVESRVIRLRFGLGCDPLTLREIGETVGLSRERVRQIEQDVTRKLGRRLGVGRFAPRRAGRGVSPSTSQPPPRTGSAGKSCSR